MELERKNLAFELRASTEDGAEFEGFAACFHNIDSYGDIISPGAFKDTLGQFLAEGFIGGMNHDWSEPIGRPLAAEEQERGLFAKARISDTSAGRDVRTLIKDGVVKKLSIGFRTLGRTWLEDADEVMAYWQSQGYTPTAEDTAASAYGARLLTKIRLYEFSPVAVPANRLCDITAPTKEGGPAGGAGAIPVSERIALLRRQRAELDVEIASVTTKSSPEAARLYAQYLAGCARAAGVSL